MKICPLRPHLHARRSRRDRRGGARKLWVAGMMNSPRQADIARALKAVQSCGLPVMEVRLEWIERGGKLVQTCHVVTSGDEKPSVAVVRLG